MVNLVIFRDGGEILIAYVLKEEIKTSMIKCGKRSEVSQRANRRSCSAGGFQAKTPH